MFWCCNGSSTVSPVPVAPDGDHMRELKAEVDRLDVEIKDKRREVAYLSAEIEKLRSNLHQCPSPANQLQEVSELEGPLISGKDTEDQGPLISGNDTEDRAAQSAHEDKVADVQARIERGLLRRDEATLRAIFQQHCEGIYTPKRGGLLAALREFSPSLDADDLVEMERIISLNSESEITYEQFKLLVNLPSKVEQWVQSLPTSALLADAISALSTTGQDLRPVSELRPDQIASVCQGLIKGLEKMLTAHLKLLRDSYKVMDAKDMQAQAAAASKFQVVKMSYGAIDDFYAGIEGRTGFPNMQFKKGMETEHCHHHSSGTPFTTPNYNITTTPSQEWEYVVARQPCPHMAHGRIIPEITFLMTLKIVIEAKLSEEEVIAIVLYTGPMFMVFNAILRRYPEDLYTMFGAEGKGFSTTIFVLVSAVQKLSRSVALPDGLVLYRGLGGLLDLPDVFFHSDAKGRKGYAEWGFMSTTARKEVALQYSGVKEGRPRATVLVITTGAVDRGACIQELSQYPGEVEYLWLPCSWLAQRGGIGYEVTGEGVVRMVPCEVRANMRAMTSEELVVRKKQMHLTAFRYALDDVALQLRAVAQERHAEDRLQRDPTKNQRDGRMWDSQQWSVEGYLEAIMEECRRVLRRHEAVDAREYTDEARFRGLSLDVAETTHMTLSKLLHWLDDPSGSVCYLHGKRLREVHRQRIGYLARMVAGEGEGEGKMARALEACKVKGLVEREIDEKNELGESRLLAAAADGRAPADIRLLAAAGADLHSRDEYGNTPLHAAAKNGHYEVVRTLVSLRADVDAAAKYAVTPLYEAAHDGHVECARALVDAKADVKAANGDGVSPLYTAACYGHVEVIRMLIESKADVDAKSNVGATPIYIAADKGHVDAVRALMEGKADLDIKTINGPSPIYVAAQNNRFEVVRMLIEGKADVDAKIDNGASPIFVAAERGHVQVVQILMEAKADLDAKMDIGASPIYMAAQEGKEEVVRALMAGKADIDAKTNYGITPIMIAACYGRVDVVRALLEGKADLTSEADDGQTALEVARMNGHTACANLLSSAE